MRGDLLGGSGAEGVRHRPAPSFGAVVDAGHERLLLAEAEHRIANHLSLLTGYVRLRAADLSRQADAPSREVVRLLLEAVGLQIDAVARLHRGLAVNEASAPGDLGEHLHAICAPFKLGLAGSVEFVEDLPPGCVVKADQLLPITQIIAEVVTNAVKHAHAIGEPGVILVRCSKDDAGTVRVEVIDDGPGLPPTFDPEADGGLGFSLLRSLGKKLGALTSFVSTGRGLRFRLTLPSALG